MDRYALVNEHGQVINVLIWDGAAEYKPHDNHVLIFSPICDIGDNYDFEQEIFIKPDRTAADQIEVQNG